MVENLKEHLKGIRSIVTFYLITTGSYVLAWMSVYSSEKSSLDISVLGLNFSQRMVSLVIACLIILCVAVIYSRLCAFGYLLQRTLRNVERGDEREKLRSDLHVLMYHPWRFSPVHYRFIERLKKHKIEFDAKRCANLRSLPFGAKIGFVCYGFYIIVFGPGAALLTLGCISHCRLMSSGLWLDMAVAVAVALLLAAFLVYMKRMLGEGLRIGVVFKNGALGSEHDAEAVG